jgi:hypothetical protein
MREGKRMLCAYCGKRITDKEMKNETFVSIREFRYGKKKEGMEFLEGGFTRIVHRRCFVPPQLEEHPCKMGLVE